MKHVLDKQLVHLRHFNSSDAWLHADRHSFIQWHFPWAALGPGQHHPPPTPVSVTTCSHPRRCHSLRARPTNTDMHWLAAHTGQFTCKWGVGVVVLSGASLRATSLRACVMAAHACRLMHSGNWLPVWTVACWDSVGTAAIKLVSKTAAPLTNTGSVPK